MARSRVYDEDIAIARAMNLFWRKGYEPTSISDLTAAMGINKGSLYHSFGSKQELFLQVFLKYNVEYRRATLQRMAQHSNPCAAIADLFELIVQQSIEDEEKKGCFLVNTALEMSSHSEDVQVLIRQGMAEFEAFFLDQLALAKEQQLIPQTVDVPETAKGLLALVIGMRVLARGVFSESGLNAIRLQALKLINA